MEDFFDRLDRFMKIKGLNDNQMTIKAGLSIGALGKQRKGARGLSVDSIAKILHSFSDLSADWLITGRGEMLVETKITDQNGPNCHAMLNMIQDLSIQLGEARKEIEYLKGKGFEYLEDIDESDSSGAGGAGCAAAG